MKTAVDRVVGLGEDSSRWFEGASAADCINLTAAGHAFTGVKDTDFPLPHRIIRYAAPLSEKAVESVAELREFAKWQAGAANGVVERLRALDRPTTAEDWSAEYWHLVEERSRQKPLFLGTARLSTRITDDAPNFDIFGDNVRGDGAVRDPVVWRWVRGRTHPAREVYIETGRRSLARFRCEGMAGDVLQNVVCLSNGVEVNGNRILRNERAKWAWFELLRRNMEKGWDVSRLSSLTEKQVIVATATEADRLVILGDAFEQLARPGALAIEDWADIAYKLYQSPQTISGSDAVIRTYLAAAGEFRSGRVPRFPHDIDLRGMTMSQRDFIEDIVEHDSRP
ncbi:hypothetical protein [Nocardia brasiliensis]|uniref:hypothetical protein n=1 Tax=Nocardia brasiliensis TaxID=37326 RepID=UPI00245858AA|nr:hypothetical protein [Nocardia brasiliensis]